MVLHAVFQALFEQRVALEAMLLKPNMVIPGKDVLASRVRAGGRDGDAALPAPDRAGGGARHRVPVGRPERPTGHRPSERDQRLPGPKPWKLSFSYGRALQDAALEAWHGRDENVKAGQRGAVAPGPVQRSRQSRPIHG